MLRWALWTGGMVLLSWSLWFWVLRHRDRSQVQAIQVRQAPLTVELIETRRLYFGSGHWGYGGGGRSITVRFTLAGSEVEWTGSGPEQPRALQIADSSAYLIVQEDPLSVSGRTKLHFLVSNGASWKAIEAREFPAALAVCNLSPHGPRWTTGVEGKGSDTRVVNVDERFVQELLDAQFGNR